jgi:hypothetical protein
MSSRRKSKEASERMKMERTYATAREARLDSELFEALQERLVRRGGGWLITSQSGSRVYPKTGTMDDLDEVEHVVGERKAIAACINEFIQEGKIEATVGDDGERRLRLATFGTA